MKLILESDLIFRPFHYFESHSMLFFLSDTRTQMLCFSDMHYSQMPSMFFSPRVFSFRFSDEKLQVIPNNLHKPWLKEAFLVKDNHFEYVFVAQSLLLWQRSESAVPKVEDLINNQWQNLARLNI